MNKLVDFFYALNILQEYFFIPPKTSLQLQSFLEQQH